MSKLVKDYIEVSDQGSLDALIERLVEVRDSLSNNGEVQVRMRGDDVFGRHLSISFMRPQTAAEAECDARYADAYRESRERELSQLQDELGFCSLPQRPARQLRIVA
ncbi:hypothetical protein E2493_09090 [Sphingomonas parva]|uniref:Uncharacterized protein n=1 Tax=Sphingomonas parva TaxID=2555898 RepID=A0A4Y8ZUZ6_9SPHN|nr:hypothetical protein [Sphingomonas parva]TFI58569.1 hypothetical protein E2493_09090 [Sphingomonas parva]